MSDQLADQPNIPQHLRLIFHLARTGLRSNLLTRSNHAFLLSEGLESSHEEDEQNPLTAASSK